MKHNKLGSFLSLILSASMFTSANILPVNANESELADSGINYKEYVGTIQNPGAGYTTTCWAVCKPNDTPVYNPTGSQMLFFIDIGAFSSGANGTANEDGKYIEGKDFDLDDTFFESWNQTFENCRKNGCMIALRFRYDAVGKDNPEPSSFDMVLKHIKQIKESNLLERYSDIISFVESGFVGKWGEQHGGKYTSVQYKAQLLDAMLDAVPDEIPVTVRTLDTFAEWAGIKRSELMDETLYSNAELSGDLKNTKILSKRVGLYNDGYMGSDSDLGTFSNREIETDWLNRVATETYYGGEFSGDFDWAMKFDTYLPQNAIPEMYKTHLSYINSNIFPMYKDYTFDKNYDIDGVDNSAYYGQTTFQFIRDHLGYRFVLRDSDLSVEAKQGGELKLDFDIENTGFANPIPYTETEIILEKNGDYISVPVEIEANKFYSCTTTESKLTMKLPDSISTGEWNVYIKMHMGYNDVSQFSQRSIRFANEGVWNGSLGANYLGTFNVTESQTHGTDNYFYSVNDKNDKKSEFLTINGTTVADGMLSHSSEWDDEMLVGENEKGQKMYVKADEEYLYVRGILSDKAEAPVYNIQLTNENGEYYWLYYASNGFVYFNHDSYDGCICKWSENEVEFRIPFEVMGIHSGTELTKLRIFLQDSANDWVSLGDVKADKVTVNSDLTVYSAKRNLRLDNGDNLNLKVYAHTESASYQWMLNGNEISKPSKNGDTYSKNKVTFEDEGIYSVKITTDDGIEKIVEIANVIISDSSAQILKGDVNSDGKIDSADLTVLNSWLLGKSIEADKSNSDLNNDGLTDVFDLVVLRNVISGT